jgi:polysaccharide biosynthesis/export protein
MKLLLVVAAALALHMAPAHAQSSGRGPSDEVQQLLRPGDAVRVAVWRREDLSGEFAIATDGTIIHPILRRVAVAGVPLAEAERRVAELLRDFEGEADFVIEPLVRVTVSGHVRQPNLFFLPLHTTLSQAIGYAGGATETGRLQHVELTREGHRTLHDLANPGPAGAELRIRSGDQIVVSRRRDIVRDWIVPIGTVTAAVATLVSLLTR